MRTLVLLAIASGCHDPAAATPDAPGDTGDAIDAPANTALPQLAFCTVSDATNLAAAWTTTTDGSGINYTCAQPCSDWHACQFGWVDAQGAPVRGRGNMQFQALAFVVDGVGGHLVFSPDGTDVVVTHAGSGGISTLNPFDRQLQQLSPTIKTVSLGWALGAPQVLGAGAGWFTRKDAAGTSVRALAIRPAAALQWIHDNFAGGHKLASVGGSMGTAATLGADVWYGTDALFDYQLMIGGPGFWDVNAGCGRVHIAAGFCDTDASPCTGNPMSSYGNDDPVCPGGVATNNCRVPTIMAPLGPNGSAYDNVINYVGATTACAPQPTDARDPALDVSSMAMTVASWSLHPRIDFIADEGGVQPPDADQGMGEGHMLYIYNAITSAKGWHDDEGGYHVESFSKVGPAMQAAAQMVVDNL